MRRGRDVNGKESKVSANDGRRKARSCEEEARGITSGGIYGDVERERWRYRTFVLATKIMGCYDYGYYLRTRSLLLVHRNNECSCTADEAAFLSILARSNSYHPTPREAEKVATAVILHAATFVSINLILLDIYAAALFMGFL